MTPTTPITGVISIRADTPVATNGGRLAIVSSNHVHILNFFTGSKVRTNIESPKHAIATI